MGDVLGAADELDAWLALFLAAMGRKTRLSSVGRTNCGRNSSRAERPPTIRTQMPSHW